MTMNDSANETDLQYLNLNGQPWGYVLMALNICIIFPIVIGNVMVIIAYKTTPKLQIPINLLLVNLAFTDIIAGLISIPMTILVDYSPFGLEDMQYPCILGYTLKHIPLGVSCIIILSIGIVRCISVTYPFHSKIWITGTRVKIVAVFLWIYFITLISVYAISVNQWKPGTPCDINLILGHTYTMIISAHVVIVLIFSTGFYVVFIVSFRRSERNVKDIVHKNNNQDDKRITKMVMTVVGCYYACWIPQATYIVAAIILFPDKDETHTANVVQHFTLFALFCNSFVNPIIYAGFNRTFKESFKRMFDSCFSYSRVKINNQEMNSRSTGTDQTA